MAIEICPIMSSMAQFRLHISVLQKNLIINWDALVENLEIDPSRSLWGKSLMLVITPIFLICNKWVSSSWRGKYLLWPQQSTSPHNLMIGIVQDDLRILKSQYTYDRANPLLVFDELGDNFFVTIIKFSMILYALKRHWVSSIYGLLVFKKHKD